ncbi:lactoylglutathione lyase [Tuber borchii]|uniref:lactoylglutathione lyase n=1 Tax=Tuber borchii TaxID=42251 RepID=A0A2T6ZMD9_TUBBO|nr:lactoylglutathione lyase [Tuber borchii]
MATNTSLYKMNHTMLRVKDPKRSVEYYQNNFGMKLIRKLDFEESKFSLYFLAFDSPGAESAGRQWTDREGILELTHNHGTENDENYKVNTGNVEPHRGFGHICISVDHLEKACEKLESNNVPFQKRPSDGHMKHIAFVLDPDGYWIEIVGQKQSDSASASTNLDVYHFSHTMLRVKDVEKSMQFYRSVLGMSLLRTCELPEARFNVYFLGYAREGEERDYRGEENPLLDREGVVELTWNYGTEKEEGFKYHNGNEQPQGFGHLCISVDDLDAACARFEDLNINWKKRLTDGKMKNVAFILDPDNYWIEVIQNESIKSRVSW